MHVASRRLFVALLASVICTQALARSQQSVQASPRGDQGIKLDRYGDPIPPQALLRLGTVRLRQGQGANGVAFTPDGKSLVSCDWQKPINVWDVATGREVKRFTIKEPNECTFGVAFSKDGSRMATIGERGLVKLWDPRSDALLSSVNGHADRTFGVAFSPDGTVFATGGTDSSVRLWDATTGTQLLEFTNNDRAGGNARPVAFSPDGNLLASATYQGTIQIWNLKQGGEPLTIPQAHERDIASLVFSPDGKQLISGGIRLERTPGSARSIAEIFVWNVANGSQHSLFEAGEELLGGSVLVASNDGTLLVSAHHEKIVVWELATRRVLRAIQVPNLDGARRTHSLAISPDNRIVAITSSSNKVFLWDVVTGSPLLPQTESHHEGALTIAFSPDDKFIATGSADNTVRLWNADTGEHIRKLDEGSGWARYVEFFPDGERVAIGRETYAPGGPGFQGEMKICRVADGGLVRLYRTPDRVMCGAISADGSRLAAGIGLSLYEMESTESVSPSKILVWDADLGGLVTEMSGTKSQFQQLVFTNDASELWSLSNHADLRKWNSKTGKELQLIDLQKSLEGNRADRSLLNPTASHAVFSSLESIGPLRSRGALRVHSLAESANTWQPKFFDVWPNVLATSRDGRLLAAYLTPLHDSEAAGRIVIWTMDKGEELLSFDVGDRRIRSLAFSQDGRRLASGMELGDTLLWDVSATRIGSNR